MASFEIKRRNGDVYTVLVDDEDLERAIAAGPWRVTQGNGKHTPYVVRTVRRSDGSRTDLIMHRWLLGAPAELQVDHMNRDGLDNRRCNLRVATRAQNSRNIKVRSDNKTGAKGVHYDASRSKKWRGHIAVDGKQIFLGRFDTKEEAHAAYCEASKRLHGEFGRTA